MAGLTKQQGSNNDVGSTSAKPDNDIGTRSASISGGLRFQKRLGLE